MEFSHKYPGQEYTDIDDIGGCVLDHATENSQHGWNEQLLTPNPLYKFSSSSCVYVIGGCEVDAVSPPHAAVVPSNEMFRFNNCTWRRLRPMAHRRCFFGAVAMGDRFIFVFGGQGDEETFERNVRQR